MRGALCSVSVSIGIEKHEGGTRTVVGENLVRLIDGGHPRLRATLVWVRLLCGFPAVVHERERNGASTEVRLTTLS